MLLGVLIIMTCGVCGKELGYQLPVVHAHLAGRHDAVFCRHGIEVTVLYYSSTACECCHTQLTADELKLPWPAGARACRSCIDKV